MNPISKALERHYASLFSRYGASSEGVGWGSDEAKVFLRYVKMLNIVAFTGGDRASVLDVGCGYGGLQQFAIRQKIDLDYTGLDVADNMIEWAAAHGPSGHFIQGDILDYRFSRRFDYVVCNGILTQKLDAAGLEMDQFANRLIRRLFSLCTIGTAFNVMTTKVNYYANNLYYRNPAELFSWCLTEVTPYIKLDHSYPLYEYTLYLYRNPV